MAEWAGTVILFERCAFSAEFLSHVCDIRTSKLRDVDDHWMFEFPFVLTEDEVRMLSEVISRLRPLQIPVNLEKADEEADHMKSFGVNAMLHRVWQKAKVAFIEGAEGATTPVTISFASSKKSVRKLVPGDAHPHLLEAARLMAGRPERVYTYEKFMATIAQKE